jgi:hypothetical protein
MGRYDHRSMAGSTVCRQETITAQHVNPIYRHDQHSRVRNSAPNQQNMIMLLAIAAEVSQQHAPLKSRPTLK